MKLPFSGKNFLLLGGSCDLGLELARLLIQNDCFPVLTCRSQSGEEKIHSCLKEWCGCYRIEYLNFSREETIANLFDGMDHSIDGMVDCIHGNLEGLVGAVDTRDVHAYFTENISRRAEVIKRTGRRMLRQKKGRMIFISSLAAEHPNPGQGFYAASKLASEALYRNMGRELKDRGITTIILRPGYIDAGRGKQYLDDKKSSSAARKGGTSILTVEEVSEVILFLLSESSRGVTTTTITLGDRLVTKEWEKRNG